MLAVHVRFTCTISCACPVRSHGNNTQGCTRHNRLALLCLHICTSRWSASRLKHLAVMVSIVHWLRRCADGCGLAQYLISNRPLPSEVIQRCSNSHQTLMFNHPLCNTIQGMKFRYGNLAESDTPHPSPTPNFRQLPIEVKLFALGYLPPHDVDTLQLVDYSLCTLVEAHRQHYLARHSLKITYDPRCPARPLRFGNLTSSAMRGVHGCENAYPLDDSAIIELMLDSNRVSSVYRIDILGDLPPRGEELLAARLESERIPVGVVEIYKSPEPMPALQLVNRLQSRLNCLKWDGINGDELVFPRNHALYHRVPHLICEWSSEWVLSTQEALQLLFNQGFSGRAVFQLAHVSRPQTVWAFVGRVLALLTGQPDESGMALGEGDPMPRDFLLRFNSTDPAGNNRVEWPTVLGEPNEERVRMVDPRGGRWWMEGEWTPLWRYYQPLDDCVWALWRVRGDAPHLEGRHLRVLWRHEAGEGGRGETAVHFRVVADKNRDTEPVREEEEGDGDEDMDIGGD